MLAGIGGRVGVESAKGGVVLRADLYLAIKLSGVYQQAVEEGQVPEVQKQPDDQQAINVTPEVV